MASFSEEWFQREAIYLFPLNRIDDYNRVLCGVQALTDEVHQKNLTCNAVMSAEDTFLHLRKFYCISSNYHSTRQIDQCVARV